VDLLGFVGLAVYVFISLTRSR